jgi:hypothetical protein
MDCSLRDFHPRLLEVTVESNSVSPFEERSSGQFFLLAQNDRRLYRNGALMQFLEPQSGVKIEVTRIRSDTSTCALLVRVIPMPMDPERVRELERAVLLQENVSLERGANSSETAIDFRIVIPDTWAPEATSITAQVMHRLLDVLGVDPAPGFEVKLSGQKSLESVREMRKQQKTGNYW